MEVKFISADVCTIQYKNGMDLATNDPYGKLRLNMKDTSWSGDMQLKVTRATAYLFNHEFRDAYEDWKYTAFPHDGGEGEW